MRETRKYDKEFKVNAVKLSLEEGKHYGVVARNLGIPESTLYSWIQEYNVQGDKGFRGSGIIKASNEEFHELKK